MDMSEAASWRSGIIRLDSRDWGLSRDFISDGLDLRDLMTDLPDSDAEIIIGLDPCGAIEGSVKPAFGEH
jgi:hypothetical protein